MTARRAGLFVLVLPTCTVPWFLADAGVAVWGLPWWALYSVLATVVLALAVVLVLAPAWEKLADEADRVREPISTDVEGPP